MVRSARVVAFNTDLDSAQAFVFSRDNTHLMAVVSASGEDVFTQTRQAVLDLQEEFFESEESISKRFGSLGDAILDRLASVEQISLLLAAFKSEEGEPTGASGILYLQGVGSGAAYLRRQIKTLALVTQEQEGRLISGYLQNGDRVLLLSGSLHTLLSADLPSLETLLDAPLDQFEETVNALVSERENVPLAGILVHYNVTEKELQSESPTSFMPDGSRRLNLPPLRLPFSPQALISALVTQAKNNIPKNNRGRLLIGAALIAVVLAGVITSSHIKASKQKQAELQSDIIQAKQELSTAEGLKELDMVSAKASLDKAKADVAQALTIDPKNTQALSLQQQVNQSSDDILKVYHVTDWPTFLDLGLIKDGFSSVKLSFDSGQVLLLDTQRQTLVSIDTALKSNQILAGSSQLGQAQASALSSQIAAVYSADKGVTEVNTQSAKSSPAVKPDSDWGKIADLSLFSGNIYLLDEFKNQVWKYVPASSGYSSKQPYLKSDVTPNFAGARKMLIDGSIWVLKPGNEIDKFTSGEVDSFSLSGLDKDLTDVKSFYVSSDTSGVYILDVGNSRVVVVEKNGKYVSQYTGDKFQSATDLAVDETNKKLYLLNNNIIYQIGLH